MKRDAIRSISFAACAAMFLFASAAWAAPAPDKNGPPPKPPQRKAAVVTPEDTTGVATAPARFSFTARRTLKIDSPVTVTVSENTGDVYIRKSAEKQLGVTAIKTAFAPDLASARREASKIDISVVQPSSGIEVRSIFPPEWKNSGVTGRVDYAFAAPDEASFMISNGEGEINIRGIKANADVRTASGSVVIGSVGGAVTVRGGSGDVTVHDCPETIMIETASGTVDFGAGKLRSESVSIRTRGGDVRLSLSESIGAAVDISTVSGKVDLSDAGNMKFVQQNGVWRYDPPGAGPKLTVRSESGDISVRTYESAGRRHMRGPDDEPSRDNEPGRDDSE